MNKSETHDDHNDNKTTMVKDGFGCQEGKNKFSMLTYIILLTEKKWKKVTAFKMPTLFSQ